MFRLVVGERLDVAAMRGDDDQSSAIAVVDSSSSFSPRGLLLGGRGIDGNAVQASPELLLLGAVEPTPSTATHAHRVGGDSASAWVSV